MEAEIKIDPLHLPMHRAIRCKARSKRTGKPCRSPAVRGCTVCRMHGAGGGGPKGKRNGRYKDGRFTAEAIAYGQAISALIRREKLLGRYHPIKPCISRR